jgi:hypothetical protein
MSTNIQDAQRRGPTATAHLATSPAGALYPHVQTPGGLTLRKSQAVVLNRRRTYNVFNASTLPENALSSAAFADVRLQGCDVVDGVTLRVTVQNATGAALGLWSALWTWNILSHVDVLAEGGSTVLERIEPDHLIREWAKLDRPRHLAVHKGLTGEQSSHIPADPPPPFADGTSRTILIPLLGSMLDSQEIAPFALASPIILRCYFRGSSVFSGPFTATQIPNGTAGLTVTAFDAVVTAHQYDNSERQSLANRYAAAGLRSPPLDIRYARTGLARTTENVTSTTGFHHIRLSSVQGLVTSINIVVRDIATWGLGLILTPQAIDLLDEKGASVYGQPLDYSLLASTECRDQGVYADDAVFARILPVPIGGEASEHSGAISGYMPMSGHHQLAVKFAATGALEVSVIYRTVSHVRIERSHITVHSS